MSTSNPFRRKQLAVLGLGNTRSNDFHSTRTRNSNGSRHQSPIRLGIQDSSSPEANSDASENDDEPKDTFTSNPLQGESGRRANPENLYNAFPHPGLRAPRDDGLPIDPFASEWIEEHSEDDELAASSSHHDNSQQTRRYHNDLESAWRLSRAPNLAAKEPSRDIPSKAQKTLGMSNGTPLTENAYRQKLLLSPEIHNLAPKALRTLGIPSNPFQRPSSHEDERKMATKGSKRRTPLDGDEFKRLLLTGDKDGLTSSSLPLHTPQSQGLPGDSGSNTDASSLSRHSIQDRETPRTSHETFVSEDEVRNSDRAVSPLSERKNSYPWTPLKRPAPGRTMTDVPAAKAIFVDPASYLTEPFSHGPLTSPQTSPGHGNLAADPVELSAVAEPVELPTDPLKSASAPTSRRQTTSRMRQIPNLADSILEESWIPVPFLQRNTSTKAPAPPPPRRSGNRTSIIIDPLPNTPKLPPSGHPKSYQPPKAPPLPQLNPSPLPSPSPPTEATFFAPPTTTIATATPPPLPPTRSASTTKRPSRVPLSSNSSLSALPTTSLSSLSASSIPPPAPPPRRHNSTSTRRPSTDSTTDIASLNAVVDARTVGLGLSWSSANAISKAAAAGQRDLLADLGKLQREVDALRGGLEGDGMTRSAGERERAVRHDMIHEEH